MTVRELIEALADMNLDQEVHIGYVNGDYWRTTVTEKLENVHKHKVKWSDYHNSYRTVNESDDTADVEVVLLQG